MNSKSLARFFFAVAISVLGNSLFAAETNIDWAHYNYNLPSKDSPEVKWWRDSQTNLDERLAWWRDARFGMFIHWGVYSGLGNEYQGRKGGGYAEHIQRILKIPIADYRANVAGHFDPTNFNADEWVRLARDAGMKYIVITAKHHDGFAMWPTKVNDYNIMDATPWHHDPMADLKTACDKYGIKFGFYYSQAFDWGNSNAPGNDWDFNNPGGDKKLGGTDWWTTRPEFMAQARKYVDEKAIPQLLELIHNYHPAILWFDTPQKLPPSENLRILKAIRQADPNVVISGRLVRGWGDYEDTADRPANFPPHDGDWEAIPTTDESYGWNPFDNSHKPPSHFIQLLAKASARGGNVLLNIGPMGDGNIDPKDVTILKGLADWWKVNGDSIRGTQRTPLPVQTWGESTRKGNLLYLHVFNWPTNNEIIVGGLKSNGKNASLLSDNPAWNTMGSLQISNLSPLDLRIEGLPDNPMNFADTVIALQCDNIQTDTNRLLQPEFPSDTLRSFDGELHGGLKFGPGKKTDDVVQGWTRTNQFVSWPVRMDTRQKYAVWINYDASADSVSNTFLIAFSLPKEYRMMDPGEILEGTVQPGNATSRYIGDVTIPMIADTNAEKEPFSISIQPLTMNPDSELFRLRNLELRPVETITAR